MNAAQKRKFIRELCKTISAEAILNVSKMPETWDGIELRQYLADKFAASVFRGTMSPKRRRDYANALTMRNL